MIAKTFLRLERDFDKHVTYCRDEPLAQEFLAERDEVRNYFKVSEMSWLRFIRTLRSKHCWFKLCSKWSAPSTRKPRMNLVENWKLSICFEALKIRHHTNIFGNRSRRCCYILCLVLSTFHRLFMFTTNEPTTWNTFIASRAKWMRLFLFVYYYFWFLRFRRCELGAQWANTPH